MVILQGRSALRVASREVEMDEQQPLRDEADTAGLDVCYFGASTGGGAALRAAADPRVTVRAVVSRGGRPDLAGAWLARVPAPTLLIVGGRDVTVLQLNEQAAQSIPAEYRIAVIPGATHLFEEPGALEQVAALARDWFCDHLTPIEPQP